MTHPCSLRSPSPPIMPAPIIVGWWVAATAMKCSAREYPFTLITGYVIKPAVFLDPMPRPCTNPSKPSKLAKTTKASLTEQLRELPTDVLVDVIERHAKTVPALRQEMMRLVGNDKTVITEIRRAIKKLAATRPNTRSRPKEIQAQLVAVLELIKHVSIPRPHEALELLCGLLNDASNVVGSFSSASVVATFFRSTLPAFGAKVIARCSDDEVIATALRTLLVKDQYRTNALFLQGVGDVLSDTLVNEFRTTLTRRIKPKKYSWDSINDEPTSMLKALEVAVGNTAGYEKAARLDGSLSYDDALVLAQMCIDHEAYFDALTWLDKVVADAYIPGMRTIQQKRDALYVQIAKSTGSTTHAVLTFRALLLTQPSTETVDLIRSLLGDEGTIQLLNEAAAEVAQKEDLAPNVMAFYVANGFDEMMEERMPRPLNLLKHDLEMLPALAHTFIAKHRPFGAVLVYRLFVKATLSTSTVGMYDAAARAIREMYNLSKKIRDWNGTVGHKEFVQDLRTTYKTKSSFWRNMDLYMKHWY